MQWGQSQKSELLPPFKCNFVFINTNTTVSSSLLFFVRAGGVLVNLAPEVYSYHLYTDCVWTIHLFTLWWVIVSEPNCLTLLLFKKKNHFVYLLIYYSFPLEMCEILMLISLEPVLLWILNTCPDKTRMSNTQKWARVMKVKKTDVKEEKRARAGDQSHLIFWISIIKKK